ncbi:hypothetical protein CEXT_287431 [Caerostris extrusa]|uniref:Uncharacterized protein n=1 Tax=Caerostris extrusa TaxID=172846 RepID=A0AAV4PWD2_CAEEX|nr:hypothetical protein CEXT_287431 [Caerostris extrusa]
MFFFIFIGDDLMANCLDTLENIFRMICYLSSNTESLHQFVKCISICHSSNSDSFCSASLRRDGQKTSNASVEAKAVLPTNRIFSLSRPFHSARSADNASVRDG